MNDTCKVRCVSGIPSQQGSVLIISLFILLVLTIIGAAALNDTVMEEKMSSNFQQGNIAFQAAESAINKTFMAVSQSRDLVESAEAALNAADTPEEAIWPPDNYEMQGLADGHHNENVAKDTSLNSIVKYVQYVERMQTRAGSSFGIMDENTPAGDIIEIVSTGQVTGTNVSRTQMQGVSRLRPATGQAN